MVAHLTQWHRCRLLDDYVVLSDLPVSDINDKASDWEDLELTAADQANHTAYANPLPSEQAPPAVSATAAPFTPAHADFLNVQHAAPVEAEQVEQVAPLHDKEMAAQDAASGATEDANPRPQQEAAPIQAEQADQAAPAQADQMAAQEGAPAAVKNTDPFAAALAAPIQAEQASQAAPAQANQMAAQEGILAAVKKADPFAAQLAAQIQAEQAKPAAPSASQPDGSTGGCPCSSQER